MATDVWNGSGNWASNPADWSTGTAAASGDVAIIESGNDNLTTSASVQSVEVVDNATLSFGDGATLTTTGGLNDDGTFNVTGNGDHVSIGGTLSNANVTNIGYTALNASTTVTADGLSNSSGAFLTLQGNASSGTSDQATLAISGTTSETMTGSIRVLGDADLELSNGITAIGLGGFLQVDGTEARASIGAGTSSSALTGLTLNDGTANFDGNCDLGAGGTTITTTTNFTNDDQLIIDYYGNDGATNVTFGGTLTNNGVATIGNTSLGVNGAPGVATRVTASGLVNNGQLNLQGNFANGATNEAILDITGTGPSTITGSVRVGGDADLEVGSTITAIGNGSALELDGDQARVSLGAGTSSSALSQLSVNDGTLLLRGDTGDGSGGASLTTATGLTNLYDLFVDSDGGDGGSTLTIGGTLTNDAQTTIGNNSLGASTTVTASGLVNSDGLVLQGNATSGTTDEAVLNITGAVSSTLTGSVRVSGDADLAAGSTITAIGVGSVLELDGAQARMSLGAGASSSALSLLSLNDGSLLVRGGTGNGAGGASLKTKTAFLNLGDLGVDDQGGEGGSKLTLGGRLTNDNQITIGESALNASTTVTATALTNAGALTLQGNSTGGTTDEAVLDITGGAFSTLTGAVRVSGDADLELAGKIKSISGGSSLELDGADARVSIGAATTSSAFSELSVNHGTLTLRGNSGYGAEGAAVTTTTGFDNAGYLNVDASGGDGGSTLTIGGNLNNQAFAGNTGQVTIGNNALSASTTVTATGLINAGVLTLQGNAQSGTANEAVLDINGGVSSTLTGTVRVSGDADLEVGSNIKSVGVGSSLELDGAHARVSIGAATTSSALSLLSLNDGTLLLRGGSGNGAGGVALTTTTGFDNVGNLDVDSDGGDGGSTLTIGGVLTSQGYISGSLAAINIGNAAMNASTTVTATGLLNTGDLTLQGNSGSGTTNEAILDITGGVPSTLTGAVRVSGEADLEVGSRIKSIGVGSSLELDGAGARVSMGAGTTSSALSQLSLNDGNLMLRGNSGNGSRCGLADDDDRVHQCR